MHRTHLTILCQIPLHEVLLMADFNQAPLLEDIGISYNFIRYEGSLIEENVFRQIGSPEVDAAWKSLGIECNSPASSEMLSRY
jgi:hypothetical protein